MSNGLIKSRLWFVCPLCISGSGRYRREIRTPVGNSSEYSTDWWGRLIDVNHRDSCRLLFRLVMFFWISKSFLSLFLAVIFKVLILLTVKMLMIIIRLRSTVVNLFFQDRFIQIFYSEEWVWSSIYANATLSITKMLLITKYALHILFLVFTTQSIIIRGLVLEYNLFSSKNKTKNKQLIILIK